MFPTDIFGEGTSVGRLVKLLRFWSRDGSSDCKLAMKMEVGRLGAPAAGPLRKAGKTCKLKRRKRQEDPCGGGGANVVDILVLLEAWRPL